MSGFKFSVPEKTPFRNLLKFYIRLNQLHKSFGGSGLRVEDATLFRILEVPESDYDLFAGTEWETKKEEKVEDILGIANYLRDEVLSAVLEVAKGRTLIGRTYNSVRIYSDLVDRYPRNIWENSFPLVGSLETIAHQNSHRLKRLITDEYIKEVRDRMARVDHDSSSSD